MLAHHLCLSAFAGLSAGATDSKSAASAEVVANQGRWERLWLNYDYPPARNKRRRIVRASVQPRLLRTREAAQYLAISQWKIRELVRDGEIAVIDEGNGGPWKFDKHDLDAYVDKHRKRG